MTSKEGMHILILAPQPFYQERGTPIAVKLVIQALVENNNSVDVLTYNVGKDIDMPNLRIYRAGKILRFKDIPIGFSFRKVLLDIVLIPHLIRLLSTRKYDCIHAVEEISVPAIILGHLFGLPVIYDMQSSLPEQLQNQPGFRSSFAQRLLSKIEFWAIRKAEYIICSAGLKSRFDAIKSPELISEWYFPHIQGSVSETDVQQLRAQHDIPATAKIVLYTGNFAGYQGMPLLIEATAQALAQAPEIVLVLVGETAKNRLPDSQHLATLKQKNAIRVVPQQPRHMISKYLGMADILVSPREHGGNLPLKIFDYLASGKPIIATDIETHRSILNDELVALVELSPAAMGSAMVDLARDQELARQLGDAARQYSADRLNWESFSEQLIRVYATVVRPGANERVES